MDYQGFTIDVVKHHVTSFEDGALEDVAEHVEAELRASSADQDDA